MAGLGLALLAGSTASGGPAVALAPVAISVDEGIVAADGARADPPANVSVAESVAANDSAVVVPPAPVTVAETISAGDAVTITSSQPTAVTVRSFMARRTAAGVKLTWKTVVAFGTLGFNLYREQRGELVKLNPRLIPRTGSNQGHAYSWLDRAAPRAPGTASYRLQAVSLNGRRSWVGSAAG